MGDKDMRYFAVGDIHGEYHKLKALIARLNIKKDDILVFLGDYIDRGKLVFETIEYLADLSKKHNCVFLFGNHEDMLMDYLSGINERLFIGNGGDATVKSYKQHGYDIRPSTPPFERKKQLPEKHNAFYKSLALYHEVDDYIFVHAGIFPYNTKLENTPKEILLWERRFHYMTYEGKTVVFGHTPNNVVLNEKCKICIDTGACFESMGDLTAVKLPDRDFIRQSWVMEDLENDGETRENNGKDFFTLGPNFSKPSKGGWDC
jgi:serine/threonine protein phosphatase 1